MTFTVSPLTTFRNEKPYPFCPGCGHGPILDGLDTSLVEMRLDPSRVVIVSDIGCSGLSDQYFATSAFHGLHGRSITYASGIKLARPDLEVIVAMGDGGTGIGGTHLINAARRNIGITVLVFNNLNFGMTGGQHSTTTPAGAVTSTTPGGNLERPLDIAATVGVNGAGYVWRGTTFDEDLPARITEAVRHPGFALLDIWELCTAYYVPSNKVSRKGLDEILDRLDLPTGVLYRRDLPEYAAAYREATPPEGAVAPRAIEADLAGHSLTRPVAVVVAGSAGGRVRSAVRTMGRAAIRAGLFAAQRDDYPITVKTGHSLSVLVLSPEPIEYTGVTTPDVLAVVSDDGLRKAAPLLERMESGGTVYANTELGELATAAAVVNLDPEQAALRLSRTDLAAAAAGRIVADLGWFPFTTLLDTIAAGSGRRAERAVTVAQAWTG